MSDIKKIIEMCVKKKLSSKNIEIGGEKFIYVDPMQSYVAVVGAFGEPCDVLINTRIEGGEEMAIQKYQKFCDDFERFDKNYRTATFIRLCQFQENMEDDDIFKDDVLEGYSESVGRMKELHITDIGTIIHYEGKGKYAGKELILSDYQMTLTVDVAETKAA